MNKVSSITISAWPETSWKNNNVENGLGVYYAILITRCCTMKYSDKTNKQKVITLMFTFNLIKPYQSFHQTHLLTGHAQHTITQSLYNHVWHSSRATGSSNLVIKATQDFSLTLTDAERIKHTTPHTHTHTHTNRRTRTHRQTLTHRSTRTHARTHARTHTHRGKRGKTDYSGTGELAKEWQIVQRVDL